MNPLETEEQNYRLIVLLASIIFACAFIGVLTLFLTLDAAEIILNRSNSVYPLTIQNGMWLMFFAAVGEIWVRYNRANRETEQLKKNLLPEEDSAMLRAKDLVPIYQGIVQAKGYRNYFLQRLIHRIILQFQGSQSVDQANSLMNSSLELMQHEIDLKYNMLRYLTWLIPTLGFIGTVVGIALALKEGANMPDVTDSTAIKGWVAGMTGQLGLAFYTTLVALIMSAVLMFLLHLAQGREEMALNGTGQYCMDNLINRLYESD